MPLGATISGVTGLPLRYGNIGPFKDSSGAFYTILRSTLTSIGIYKATNPMTSFSNVGTNQSPVASNHEAVAAYQVGDILHVVWQVATANVYYRQFDMATDAWLGTSAEPVYTAINTLNAGSSSVSIVVRSTGSVVVQFVAATASMSTYTRSSYTIRPAGGGAWSTPVPLDPGGSINFGQTSAVLGASDRVHFFYRRLGENQYTRTLSAANVLSPAQAGYALMSQSVTHQAAGVGRLFTYNGTPKVFVPVVTVDSTNGYYGSSVVVVDSVDTPTPFYLQDFDYSYPFNEQWISQGVVYNGTIHYLISSPYGIHEDDLYKRESTDAGATWTGQGPGISATSVLTGIFLKGNSVNVLNRNNEDMMCMIISDNDVIKYAEKSFIIDTTAPTIPTGMTHTILLAESRP